MTRTEGHWFDDNGHCDRINLSVAVEIVIWESSKLLGKNIVWSTGKKENPEKHRRRTGHS